MVKDGTHVGFVDLKFGAEEKGAFAIKHRKKEVVGCFDFVYEELDVLGKIEVFVDIDSDILNRRGPVNLGYFEFLFWRG